MGSKDELACTYSALILADDEVPITAEKISTILKAAKVDVEPFWPNMFARALTSINIRDLITSVGSAVGSAPAAGGGGGGAAPAAAEEEKKEEKEEKRESCPVTAQPPSNINYLHYFTTSSSGQTPPLPRTPSTCPGRKGRRGILVVIDRTPLVHHL